MLRIMVVHPGAETSTADVYDGLVPALQRAGHTVLEYPLHVRMGAIQQFLNYRYRQVRKADPSVIRPTFYDVLYLAAERVPPLAVREHMDWVLVVSGMYFHPDFFLFLRRMGMPCALLCTETPYDQDQEGRVLQWVSLGWTNERSSVEYLRQYNPHVWYLPHAYDPARHHLPTVEEAHEWCYDKTPAHDVVFVGTGFQERVDLLAGVDWAGLGIDLGLYGTWELPRKHPLKPFVKGGTMPNAQAAALYRRAKIGLNLYRRSKGFGPDAPRIDHADSLNPRALELAACGVFTLSEYRAEVQEVFGDAVPTFTTPQALTSLVRFYLVRPEARAWRAHRLPGLVADRTFDAMAARMTAQLAGFSPAPPTVAAVPPQPPQRAAIGA